MRTSAFDGYDGPVTNPPDEVTHRLERVASGLCHPARVGSFALKAVVCGANCGLQQALAMMREGDYSQLPYLHPAHGWLLVTREQISRWLEVEADLSGTVLVDLSCSVQSLADDARVGPVHPRLLPRTATVSAALTEMERALCTPDSEAGGYPVVLVPPLLPTGAPQLLTPDDLPRMYDLLGR